MTTTRQLALRLARHLGVASFDPGHASNNSPLHLPGARRGDLGEMVACLNAALSEMWEMAGAKAGIGALELYAPRVVELRLVVGEVAIAQFDLFEPWMAGCRVEVGGMVTRLTGAGALAEPYAGQGEPEGTLVTVDATVYHDTALLDEAVATIPNGVMQGVEIVATLCSVGAFSTMEGDGIADGEWHGPPTAFRLDRERERLRATFFPAPDAAATLNFAARFRMIEVRPGDIGVTDDPGVLLRALEQMDAPPGWALEVVFPLALERLLVHPDFESRLAREEIARQAGNARATVRRHSVREAARRGSQRLVPVFR